MSDFVVTADAERAAEVCQATLGAREYGRVGQIIGEPGTGKSATTYWLADRFNGVRIECWQDMNAKALMLEIAIAFNRRGTEIDEQGTSNTLFARIRDHCAGKLILVDEANHLSWQVLEKLRSLSDLGRCGLILCGTDILARRFKNARVEIYLRQLADRIGAKRVLFERMRTEEEIVAHVIQPRFGAVNKGTAHRFRVTCKGYWRGALELADACERIMKSQGLEVLKRDVVEAAAAQMAGQHMTEAA